MGKFLILLCPKTCLFYYHNNVTILTASVSIPRIQMSISLPSSVNDGSQVQSLFPLCILLARPVNSHAVLEVVCEFTSCHWMFIRSSFTWLLCASSGSTWMQNSAVYHFSRACFLATCKGVEEMYQDQAKFILPEIIKLSAEVKSGSFFILFVSFGMTHYCIYQHSKTSTCTSITIFQVLQYFFLQRNC